VLEGCILKVFGPDPYNPHARTELIRRCDKASVNMSEVKEVRFSGINITREGIQIIQTEIKEPESKTDWLDKKIEKKLETTKQPEVD